MNVKNFIAKYKIYIIISLVALVILIFTSSFKGGGVQESPSPIPTDIQEQTSDYVSTSTNFTPPSYSKPPENLLRQVDTTSEQVTTAVESKNKLKSDLPIYIENFRASNGMLTTLNVFTLSSDPEYLIRIEIYGIDFGDQNTSKDENPNVTAFIDSFEEIKKQLTKKGVDIHNIYFIFGQRTFIQETADLWIKTYNLY